MLRTIRRRLEIGGSNRQKSVANRLILTRFQRVLTWVSPRILFGGVPVRKVSYKHTWRTLDIR